MPKLLTTIPKAVAESFSGKNLLERREEIRAGAEAVAELAAGFNRDLSSGERKKFDEAMEEIVKIDERLEQLSETERRAEGTEAFWAEHNAKPVDPRFGGQGAAQAAHPLAFTSQSLTNLQAAIDQRAAGRFEAADVEERAALTTGTFGAPRAWGSNVLEGPRLLHVAAGVPAQQTDAVLAQHPNLTLPTALGSVGENVALAEYAASTAGSVTLARFGRWTDMSRESGLGTSAEAIIGMHTIGVAKDLDAVLVNATETAAGAAVAFTADVPAAIRKAMAIAIDNTAAANASDLVILVNPDNAPLLQDVTPTGGQTIAESFQNFSGALVYPSSAVDTGFVTVANLRAGARFYTAQGFMTETETAVKTSTLTIASSVIAGYGVGLTAGFAIKVDVVTP